MIGRPWMIGRRNVLLMAGVLAMSTLGSQGHAQESSGQGLAGGVSGVATAAASDRDSPVVVELYTSQGCSSCPPADDLLAQMLSHDDILPLALHVDYWDYLGWKDGLADPLFTSRQKAYARANGKRMIYTPQMVIDGAGFVKGAHPLQVAEYVTLFGNRPRNFSLKAEKTGEGSYRVTAETLGDVPPVPMVLELVQYTPQKDVSITRGENAGAHIQYVNIVNRWEMLGEWNGQGDYEIEVTLAPDMPGAVLLQRAGHGPIEAAVRLP